MTISEIFALLKTIFNYKFFFTLTIPEVNSWTSAGKDILVGASAVATTFFAYSGVTAWKKELKGKAEYQLAKDVLKSVYRVREAFKHVRNPAIFQYEYPEDMAEPSGHLKQEHKYEGTAHVYENRWKEMTKAFAELEEHHLEAQVEWGAKFQDVIVDLRSCRADLLVVIQMMLQQTKNPRLFPYNASNEKKKDTVLYYYIDSDTENEFTLKIEQAMDKFEVWLRPHIEQRK